MFLKIFSILFCILLLNADQKDISQKITQNKNAHENKNKKDIETSKTTENLHICFNCFILSSGPFTPLWKVSMCPEEV